MGLLAWATLLSCLEETERKLDSICASLVWKESNPCRCLLGNVLPTKEWWKGQMADSAFSWNAMYVYVDWEMCIRTVWREGVDHIHMERCKTQKNFWEVQSFFTIILLLLLPVSPAYLTSLLSLTIPKSQRHTSEDSWLSLFLENVVSWLVAIIKHHCPQT